MNFVATMIPFGIFYIAVACLGIYLTVLVIKALRKYLKSEPVRKEKQEAARNLGEVLKQHRVDCKMTQEFVAESLGVSRQAVSKWERAESAPDMGNLIALADLYEVTLDELLRVSPEVEEDMRFESQERAESVETEAAAAAEAALAAAARAVSAAKASTAGSISFFAMSAMVRASMETVLQ